MRLFLSVDDTDVAALPALEQWLRESPSELLEANPTRVTRIDDTSMNAGLVALEVLAAAAELFGFFMALARRHETDREPVVTVRASWPDGRKYRIDSSKSEDVEAIIRALNGS